MKFILFTVLILTMGSVVSQERFIKLPVSNNYFQNEKIEVIEFFWYGCPHCYQLEEHVSNWLEKKAEYIEFIRIPANLGKKSYLHTKAFYVAEKLGVLDTVHARFFDEINRQNKKLSSISSIRKIFLEEGVSAEDFDITFSSIEVREKVQLSQEIWNNYSLKGVPAMIVNRKYVTSISLAGGYKEVFEVINLLAKEEHSISEQEK